MTIARKAISTLIASIFVIFLIVAMVSSLILIMNYWKTVTTESLNQIKLASQKTMESLKAVQGPTVTSTKIELTLVNDGSTYVFLLKYYVRDLLTNQVLYGNLNKYIPVSSKVTVTINGTFNSNDNYTIILISSRYKKYIFHYPAPQIVKIANLLNDHLIRSADQGTIAWAGIAKVKKPINFTRITHSIYYNDFSNESSLNSLQILSGSWSWDNNTEALKQTSRSIEGDYGGEKIALINKYLPTNGYTYFLFSVKNLRSSGRTDVSLFKSSTDSSFYTGSIDYSYKYLEIWYYDGNTWNLINYTHTSVKAGSTYWVLSRLSEGNKYYAYTVFNTSGARLDGLTSNLDRSIELVGFGTWDTQARFDNALVTVNASPIYVNVTSLLPNWKVIITDGQGNSFSGKADINGVAAIDVITEPIIKDANVSIYSSSGSLIFSKVFPILLGGDIIQLNYEILNFPLLIVASGGFPYIDLYNLSINSSGNPHIDYWRSISTAGNVFNGKAFITYDNSVTDSLILINQSGVYSVELLYNSINKISSNCLASDIGVVAEVINDSLIVFPGNGSNELCVLNLTDLSNNTIDSLDNVVDTAYGASATDGSAFYAIARNSSSGSSKLVKYELGASAPEISSTNMPGYKVIGLAYGGGYLWLLLEGGSLYRINPSTSEITHINVLGLPAPIGPGDRIIYYSGNLILLRATGSDEVWVLPIS